MKSHARSTIRSRELSARIDLYLERFRSRIPGAERHTAPWASNLGRPMCAMAIYNAVRNRTRKAFGLQSTYIVSGMPPPAFGQSKIRPMCEAPRISSASSLGTTAKHVYYKHSRGSRGGLSLALSTWYGNNRGRTVRLITRRS